MSELLEQLCEEMHDRYEKAATGAGWETNPESRKPWSGVPEANKATMRAAIGPIADRIAELEATVKRVRELPDKWRKDYRVWNCGSCFDAPADTCIDELQEALGDKV